VSVKVLQWFVGGRVEAFAIQRDGKRGARYVDFKEVRAVAEPSEDGREHNVELSGDRPSRIEVRERNRPSSW
jgi:hypothetical protein